MQYDHFLAARNPVTDVKISVAVQAVYAWLRFLRLKESNGATGDDHCVCHLKNDVTRLNSLQASSIAIIRIESLYLSARAFLMTDRL
uniref:Uncharacterized protein n=1 Tax=Anopheles christyi TaxID=43041 RepID=A0A182JPL2_9DIPT